jgi:nitrate/TMAO reductase-like tetraheme cytochrome c subunit
VRSPRKHLLAALAVAFALGVPVTSGAQAPAPSAEPSASAAPDVATPPARPAGKPTRTWLPGPNDPVDECASCHAEQADPKLAEPARQFLRSVHRDERIGCAGCHKGDPREHIGELHKSNGFVARPSRADVAAMCGGCHADAAFMRHLNSRLPVGQLALYELSQHGKLSAAGDANGPTCSDCHGVHEIHRVASPKAKVSRPHLHELCGSCHADPGRMAKYDLKADQLAKWERGVHGQAFAKGNPNAPTCNGCHGPHSANPPEASTVARACGRCHEDEASFFEQSAHSKGFRRQGLAECVVCHSNHDVGPATALLVGTGPDSTCAKCHKSADKKKPLEVAEELARLLGGARARASEARAAIANANQAGLHLAGAAFALDRVATAELALRGVVHTLDPARLAAPVAAVDTAVDAAKRLVTEAEARRRTERRGYYVALALAATLFVSLVLKSLELQRKRRQGSP